MHRLRPAHSSHRKGIGKSMTKDWLTLMNRVPPFQCRMVAVRLWRGRERTKLAPSKRRACYKIRRIPVAELVRKSGIPRRSFIRISRFKNWNRVPAEIILAFSKACDVDLLARNPLQDFLKRKYVPGLPYFTAKQRKFFDKMFTSK